MTILKLLSNYQRGYTYYNAGETAAFPDAEATALVQQGAAVVVTKSLTTASDRRPDVFVIRKGVQ